MKRIIGMGIGIVYLGIAYGAYTRAAAGWDTGYGDVGLWWTVIAIILTIAAGGALIGTWIHTQQADR